MLITSVIVNWRSSSSSEMYVEEVETGRCDGNVTPAILKETAATAYVDGRNGIGMVG